MEKYKIGIFVFVLLCIIFTLIPPVKHIEIKTTSWYYNTPNKTEQKISEFYKPLFQEFENKKIECFSNSSGSYGNSIMSESIEEKIALVKLLLQYILAFSVSVFIQIIFIKSKDLFINLVWNIKRKLKPIKTR